MGCAAGVSGCVTGGARGLCVGGVIGYVRGLGDNVWAGAREGVTGLQWGRQQ